MPGRHSIDRAFRWVTVQGHPVESGDRSKLVGNPFANEKRKRHQFLYAHTNRTRTMQLSLRKSRTWTQLRGVVK